MKSLPLIHLLFLFAVTAHASAQVQIEAESGSLVGSAQVISASTASGGAALSLPSTGAGAEYASVVVTPGPQVISITYRSTASSGLQVQLQPNGGTVEVSLPSTGGDWQVKNVTGITTTSTQVNMSLIRTGLELLDVDMLAVCKAVDCVGCSIRIYDESLERQDGMPAPPVLVVDEPPWPGFTPPHPSEFWAQPDTPFVPNPPGAVNSGVTFNVQRNISLSFSTSPPFILPSLGFNGGVSLVITNFVWDELSGGSCEWGCMLGCRPTENTCDLGVSMTVRLVLPYAPNVNFAWFQDDSGSAAVVIGDSVNLRSSSSIPCGSSTRGFVSLGMSDKRLTGGRKFLNLSYQCLDCFDL